MPFNNTDGFIPRTLEQIKQDYKQVSQVSFPSEDFSDYEFGDLFLAHYACMQNTLELENNLVGIEQSLFSFITDQKNQIQSSQISTQNGIIQALKPFVNNNQVITLTPTAGVLEIYGDFTDTTEKPGDYKQIAQTIFNAKGAGIFTKNNLGQTDTKPIPSSTENDKVIPVVDILGNTSYIYFTKATLKPFYIKIEYKPSNTNLQVLNNTQVLAQSFLDGLAKLDPFGNPLFSIGKDFEPEKYLDVSEHPFAAEFNVKWSETAKQEDYKEGIRPWVKGELMTFDITRISVGII